MISKKYFILIVGVAALIGLAVGVNLKKIQWIESKKTNIFDKTRRENKDLIFKNRIDSTQKVEPLRVGGTIYFAGERVPLEDPDVYERLDRELQINAFWHSNTLLSMKLANRYFPVIEKILEEEGVPNDFKYLPLIESGFRDVISPSGAVGFWQFLSSTAKLYNLEIKNEVDERYHVEKSTRAACAYLKTAKDKFGSWTAAAASYNLGMQAMAERCKSQGTYNYYELLLPQETARYIFRILAMKIIFSNPEAAGYYVRPEDLYQPFAFKTVQVDSSIQNIAAFAAKFGLQYRHIKLLNPWLRDNYLNNKEKKVYEIKILQ